MLAVLVFGLGVGPCGCYEHSAWAQLLPLDSAHNNLDVLKGARSDQVASLVPEDTDSHDCTGEARAQYLNNTRMPSLQEHSSTDGPTTASAIAVSLTNSIAVETYGPQTDLIIARSAALCRPSLQVYLL